MITDKQHPGLFLSLQNHRQAPCHPLNIINDMKILHGVNVSYDKALRGREIALNSIRGTYMAEEADNEGRFKFYFMALAASVNL
ncbi:uncharacterized protein E5676_scaffold572G00310 [Cucumis melo var. makuwa]|uniref:Uncharacterized protein n=1 Tax=Cucumis melo var. makuwa TaxID=1194695 RepID=A0A5A7VGR3_CUCMM|nr:uncharacterized protein E6C27_scaffold25G00510 [Cucumis melo var. makuwa]TYK06136.1 uncharacterized protein E5676_scaffold572G00310 [Cucumis melo var. makuwa]